MMNALFLLTHDRAELRRVREQVRFTQKALARLLLLSAGYVSQAERGHGHAREATLASYHLLSRDGLEVFQ